MEGALPRGSQCRSDLGGHGREEELARPNKPFAIPWYTMIFERWKRIKIFCAKSPGRQALYGSTKGKLVLSFTGGLFN
jgi:hypothetical protein